LNVNDVLLEVRKVREAYAKRFGYDLRAIHRDLKEKERVSGRRIISLPPRRPKPASVNGEVAPTVKVQPSARRVD
jgi:hypothetical protein